MEIENTVRGQAAVVQKADKRHPRAEDHYLADTLVCLHNNNYPLDSD